MTASPSLAELFQATAALRPDALALRASNAEVGITWGSYSDRVRRLAAGLAALGVGRGDRVALMLVNRPEMHLFDSAAFHLGATPFSIYNTSSPEQIAFLLASAERVVVVTEHQFLARWTASPGPPVENLVCVDGPAPGALTVADVEAGGPTSISSAPGGRSRRAICSPSSTPRARPVTRRACGSPTPTCSPNSPRRTPSWRSGPRTGWSPSSLRPTSRTDGPATTSRSRPAARSPASRTARS